jgi:UDP-GlcNAc:undecaprenyl-phosphate GlcNAc-1-phosphate transferase
LSASADASRLAIPGAIALISGVVGTGIVRSFARRFGIVNKPNPIVPQHTRPVAYLGGVGVGIAVAAGSIAIAASADAARPANSALAVAVPAVLFLALGVVDDLVALKPAKKFVLQAIVAALAVVLGVRCPLSGIPALDAALSWFWIATLVNAFNFTDVCDGLLGGLGAVMFALMALAYPATAPLSLVIAAACVGFLAFNKPPATIFLGDAGSHLLGFLAAAITIAGATEARADPLVAVAAPALLVGVPLFELTFLTVVRVRKGLAWWRGSPDHFSLRLQAGGFSRWQTDAIACTFAAAFGLGALAMPRVQMAGQLAIIGAAIVASLLAAKALLRWEVRPRTAPPVAVAPVAAPESA